MSKSNIIVDEEDRWTLQGDVYCAVNFQQQHF